VADRYGGPLRGTSSTHTSCSPARDAGCRARFLIRDRHGKYPTLFDTILAETGIQLILTGVRGGGLTALAVAGVGIVGVDSHSDPGG
jgi:hypothetical protein